MNYNKYQFSKVNDKKVLHKIKKQWVVISLAILMALGGGAAVGYTAHADATTPHVEVTGTNSKEQSPQKLASQKITNQSRSLHYNILGNSSDKSNNVGQNNRQDNMKSNVTGDQIGDSLIKSGYEEYPNDKPLTLHFQQANLIVNYYDNSTNDKIYSISKKHIDKMNGDKPNIVGIPMVPADFSNRYQYSGKYDIDRGGTIKCENGSNSTISYMMSNDSSNQIINIYLTEIHTINVYYINSKTSRVVYNQDAGPKPDGTPFDYRKFEEQTPLDYLPKGYQLDKSAHDYYDENPMNYLWYTNFNQTDKVYVKPESFSFPVVSSVINVNYVDSRTGKVIYDQDAGRKPNGTPFDYKKFEEQTPFDYLPKGYQLDESAHNYYDENPMNYLWYTNSDQTDVIYVKPVSLPTISSHQITVEYLDTNNHDKIVATKNAGSKPAGSPFSIETYEDDLPENYQLDNYAYDDWNSKSVHYPQYGINNQTDIIYVKHQIVPIKRYVTNTLTVNYRDQNGHPIPGVSSKIEQITYSQSGIKDKVTGQTSYSGSWNVINGGWPLISSPNLQSRGYSKPSRAVIDDAPSYNSGNKIETVVYHKIPARDTTLSVNRSVTNTLTVNYRDQDGHPIPGVPSKTEQITYAQSGIKDKVTGQISYSGSWNVINGGWPSIPSPDLQGRDYSKPSRAVINDVPSYNSGNKIETVIYCKRNTPNVPAHNVPVKPHDTTSSTPGQPKNTPQLPASKPNHDNTNVIHPNNGVTPTFKHVKLRKLIKRYKHHRHGYQKWIPRLITNRRKNVKYPSHYKINKCITYHFSTVTYHHDNDHQSSHSKSELPQTNESNGYHKTWSIVLTGFAMIITAFGLAMNMAKHHVK